MIECCYCGSGAEELRPYGPKGAPICFSCMMEKPEREREAVRQYRAQHDACGDVAVLSEHGPVPIRHSIFVGIIPDDRDDH